MNIWIANHYLSLDPRRGTRRHLELAEKLGAAGHRVTLVGCDRNHFRADSLLPWWQPWGRQQLTENVSILWVNSVRYSSNSYLRFVNMILFSVLFALAGGTCRKDRPKVLVASSGHLFTAMAGAVIATWHRAVFVFEIRDLWPLTPIEMGWIGEGSFVARALYRAERWLLQRADAVVGTIPGIGDYCAGVGIAERKVHWIPNGVALDDFAPLGVLRSDERFTLCYFGSIGKPNCVDVIVDAATRLSEDEEGSRVDFLIIGEGSEKALLSSAVRERRLTNVTFHDEVPRAQLRRVVEHADAFVTAVRDCPRLYRYGLSMNKISEYMALGRPIILAGDVPYNPVEAAGCGAFVSYEDAQEMAEAALQMSNLPSEDRARMGARGRAYAEEVLDYERVTSRYCDLLMSLYDGVPDALAGAQGDMT